jgi:hypothetical protein
LRIALWVLLGIAVLGLAVMLLWNWLMPVLFVGTPQVGYWQALGILALCKLLFGGFRGGAHEYWRDRRQRWASMSPEERQQFKTRWSSRWGSCCAPDSAAVKRTPEA